MYIYLISPPNHSSCILHYNTIRIYTSHMVLKRQGILPTPPLLCGQFQRHHHSIYLISSTDPRPVGRVLSKRPSSLAYSGLRLHVRKGMKFHFPPGFVDLSPQGADFSVGPLFRSTVITWPAIYFSQST
uniref:Uncharacterized protein n=1 Tax=Oncorhynchus kisutch TaxID=8019 RepID=A0A8C7F9I0_ONCKI